MTLLAYLIPIWYVLFWLGLRRRLPTLSYPFFWLFFWSTLALDVIGAPFLIDEEWLAWSYLFAAASVLIALLVTALILLHLQSTKSLKTAIVQQAPTVVSDSSATNKQLVCLLIVSVVLVAAWWRVAGSPLLFRLLDLSNLNESELKAVRTDMIFGDLRFHWYEPGFTVFPLVMAVLAYHRYLRQPGFKHALIATLATLYAAVLGLAFLLKLPMCDLIFALLATRLYSVRKKFKMTAALLVAVLALGIMTGLFWLYDPMFFQSDSAQSAALDRVFLAYARTGSMCFVLWPDRYHYLLGTTFSNPGSILPYTQVDLPGVLFNYAYNTELPGAAPAPAFAEGYVNFGWAGVVMVLFCVCGFIVVCQCWFASVKLDGMRLAFMIVLLATLLEASMNGMFYNIFHVRNLPVYAFLVVLMKIGGKGADYGGAVRHSGPELLAGAR